MLIVGAGISGIGIAYHLTTKQPGRTFAIVESRDAIGGTWDLFRYLGIRSELTCTPTASDSSRGRETTRSPMVTRSSTTCPPILLLHGIGRSLEDWARQYPRLAPTEIEVIAPDYNNEAYDRVLSSDVRYRFVSDTASLKGA